MDVSAASQSAQNSKVSYIRNERTAGLIPVYNAPKPNETEGFDGVMGSFQAQNSAVKVEADTTQDDGFGFFDLLDMINPFQHIPLVNIAYRAITGDEIKPISQIIGGGVFGGPAGIASGLVNTVIKEETGNDAIGNAMAFVRPVRVDAQKDIDIQIEKMAYDDLPVTLLEFAQRPITDDSSYNA
jgi:hypothetical protein